MNPPWLRASIMRELKRARYPLSTREIVDAIYDGGESDLRQSIWTTIHRMRKAGLNIVFVRNAKRGYRLR